MEKGERIKGERIKGEKGMGDGRVRYPVHPSNSPQYGLILC